MVPDTISSPFPPHHFLPFSNGDTGDPDPSIVDPLVTVNIATNPSAAISPPNNAVSYSLPQNTVQFMGNNTTAEAQFTVSAIPGSTQAGSLVIQAWLTDPSPGLTVCPSVPAASGTTAFCAVVTVGNPAPGGSTATLQINP
jgi:hypothetical protein